MHNWLPKAERKTILLLSDDIRAPSGVGVMSRLIVENTCHRYNWVQLGAALNQTDVGVRLDLSTQASEVTGVEDASVVVYPYIGYGDPKAVRDLIAMEHPDAILHFTDPRSWIWLYRMEREILQSIPILYYNIWDSLPDPQYNNKYYQSCDALFSISKQTYGINYRVLGPENVVLL